jgi:AcrR family transcriptional regulator
LFVQQDPESVPVRRIADAANVNHALVHRYYGTKDELLAAVLEQEAEFFAAVVDDCADADTAAIALFDALHDRGDFVTMLTRATLSGHSATRRSFESGALHRLVAKLDDAERGRPVDAEGGSDATAATGSTGDARGTAGARHAVAAYAALILGWSVFHEFLAAAVFLDGDEVAEATDFVRATASSLLRDYLFLLFAWVGEQTAGGDSPDGAVLVVVRQVAADADGADDGAALVADEDPARDGNKVAAGQGGYRGDEMWLRGRTARDGTAADPEVERAARLGPGDVFPQEARPVFPREGDKLPRGVEHGDRHRREVAPACVGERLLDDRARLLEVDHGTSVCM